MGGDKISKRMKLSVLPRYLKRQIVALSQRGKSGGVISKRQMVALSQRGKYVALSQKGKWQRYLKEENDQEIRVKHKSYMKSGRLKIFAYGGHGQNFMQVHFFFSTSVILQGNSIFWVFIVVDHLALDFRIEPHGL